MEKSFTILGDPFGKQRPRVANGHAYTPAKTRMYESAVAFAYKMQAGNEPFTGPLSAVITAYYKVSTSSRKKAEALYGKPCTKKPDADNIAKAILDSLNGLAYHDDSAVVDVHVRKLYTKDEPRVEVILRDYENDENKGVSI